MNTICLIVKLVKNVAIATTLPISFNFGNES